MKSLCALIVCLFCFVPNLMAQKMVLEPYVGIGLHSFDDVTLLQDQLSVINGVQLPSVDRFPERPAFRLYVYRETQKELIGVFLGMSSSGARSALSDANGGATVDQIITNYELGFFVELPFGIQPDIVRDRYLFFRMQVSALLSTLEIENSVFVSNGSRTIAKERFAAQNAVITPSLGYRFQVKGQPFILSAGYALQVTNFPFHLMNERDFTLQLNQNNDVGVGFSGLQFGLSAPFRF
ncbi:MAG: hypothetical protein AAFW89_06960 [Bacteroidota bacterium]